MANLLVYISKNSKKLDDKTLLLIVDNKLLDLDIKFDTKDIDALYLAMGEDNISKASGTKVVFDKIDIDAMRAMRNNFYWVGTDYSAKVQNRLKGIIDEVFMGEQPRVNLVQNLRKEFSGVLSASSFYFEGVADHIINQNQNIARVNKALQYDVQHFKVMARIDSKTSAICRSMHGKIIQSGHLEKQVKNIVGADDMSSKKAASAWKNEPIFGKLPSNFGLPPYHFRCRTEVVPVWLDEEMIDDKKVLFSNKQKDDVFAHIDKTGIQRRVDKTVHDKLKNKHMLRDRDIIAALNSIREIAPHNTYNDRFVAISASGCFMVFAADKIITMYPPEGNTKKYFKNSADLQKKEVIKWR